jgi:hypothetical protein
MKPMKIFLFKSFLFFSFFVISKCYAQNGGNRSLIKTGDIVFAKYTNYFDIGISKYLDTKFSHTLIKTDEGLMSFTIDYIGDKGTIFKDPDLYADKSAVLVIRPIIKNKEAEKVYRKCVNEYFSILNKKVTQRKIMFDWNLESKKNTYVCSTFIFHILKKCLPNSETYFTVKEPDRIHFDKKGRPVILFDKALNLKKFKTIISKTF